MSTLRKLSLCTLVALFLLVVPTIFAQETFGLSDGDFALFTTANATSAAAESLAYDFTASFSLAGVGEDVSVNLTGNGVIGGTDDAPVFELVVTGEVVADGETTPADLQVRLIGDTIYFNLGGTGWQGGLVEDMMSQFTSGFASGLGGALPVDPDALASGDLSGLAGMEGMSEAMAALASMDPSEFVAISNLGDDGGLTHFQVNFAVADFLASPAMSSMMAMSMMGSSGMPAGVEMPAEQMEQMGAMMAMMFSGATITFDQWIDSATSLVNRAVLDINFPIPDLAGTGTGAGGSILLNFDISLSGFGDPVTVEAPEGATMMPSSGG
jgi:hypothetical protein